jgi:hypothetical protein
VSSKTTVGPDRIAAEAAGVGVPDGVVDSAALRRLLHDANGELNIAVLELELLLESSHLDPDARAAIHNALEACRNVAAILRCDPGTSGG